MIHNYCICRPYYICRYSLSALGYAFRVTRQGNTIITRMYNQVQQLILIMAIIILSLSKISCQQLLLCFKDIHVAT